jgi:hypothetical protein
VQPHNSRVVECDKSVALCVDSLGEAVPVLILFADLEGEELVVDFALDEADFGDAALADLADEGELVEGGAFHNQERSMIIARITCNYK